RRSRKNSPDEGRRAHSQRHPGSPVGEQGRSGSDRRPQVRGQQELGAARQPLRRHQPETSSSLTREGTDMSLTKRLHEVRTPAGGPSRRDPVLDELRQKIHHHLIDELGPLLYDRRLSEDDLRVRVQDQLQRALQKEKAPLSAADRAQLVQDVSDDILGYGPIDRYLK